MTRKPSIVLRCCALAFALQGIGLPQERAAAASGAEALATRQAALDLSSITFRSMNDAMKAGREAKTQAYAAMALAKWAKALPTLFPPGTGAGEMSNSQALAEIWKNRSGFDRLAANYMDQAAKLAELAKANDGEGFTKQLALVNGACAACHATFKAGDQGPPKK